MTKARQWVCVAAGAFVVLAAGLLALELIIGQAVRRYTAEAVSRHPGAGLEALVAVMRDRRLPMRERNHAVWALGQWGDKRALDALRSHVTGQRCDHAVRLCGKELVKAIRKLEHEPMRVPPPWRWAWGR